MSDSNAPWRIHLLGGLRAERGAHSVTRFRSQKIAACLAYLAFHKDRSHRREELADLLWPDAAVESGRGNLRTALAALRRVLETDDLEPGSILIASGYSEVSLNPERIVTDVAEFQRFIAQASHATTPAERIEPLSRAVALYGGPFLRGFYEDWALLERDRLEALYHRALADLITAYEAEGNWDKALEYARQAVAAAPLLEETHANLIRLLQITGQVAAARRQFTRLEQLLEQNLATEPRPETRALLDLPPTAVRETTTPRQILTADAPPVPVAPAPKVVAEAEPETERVALVPETFAPTPPTPATTAAPMPPAPPASNLPASLTRFFGRAEEKAWIMRYFREGGRLLTLTGSGGSGKTRLALEAASGLKDDYANGVWFVALVDVQSAARLFPTIADAMGIPNPSDAEPLEHIVTWMSARPGGLLLVLDNFEQLVEEGAAQVALLLERLPQASALVTSRQRLQVPGEQEFPLAPLAVPPTADNLERLTTYASIQMFVHHAQSIRPDFTLDQGNAETIMHLCQRLEGIPLAIELAAAWVGVLTPAEILQRLSNRFSILVSRRRGASTRHATLRATLEWSYQQLSPSLQEFFLPLAVFRGGWTLAAAEAVTGEADAILSLAELRERSLLTVIDESDEERGASGETRFRMLETMREFAVELLIKAGRDGAVTARHYEYFCGMAQQADVELRGAEQDRWLRILDRENENLRAALTWGLGEPGRRPLSLVATLLNFWSVRGLLREGLDWVQRALAAEPDATPAERARVLPLAGWLAWRTYDAELQKRAVAYSEEGYALCEQQGDRWGMAFCCGTLGLAAHHTNQPEKARTLLEKAVALAQEAGDPWLIGRSQRELGNVLMPQGDTAGARAAQEAAVAAFRRCGDRHNLAEALRQLSLSYFIVRECEAAERAAQEAERILEELRDIGSLGMAVLMRGCIAAAEKRYDDARAQFDRALDLLREVRHIYGTAHALMNRADTFMATGMLTWAQADLHECLILFRQMGNGYDILLALENAAHLALEMGQWERCVILFATADNLRASLSAPMMNSDLTRRADEIAAAERHIGPEARADAWERGRALTTDEAIRYALE